VRIGIFGGSFDPPHIGHLAVAQDALEALELDLLYFVPARISPFKIHDPGTDPSIRADLVEHALAGHPALRVWRGELERPAPSYTVETVEALRRIHPDGVLHLLMGSDQWSSFPRWRSPGRIVELATICVMGRANGADAAGEGAFDARPVPTRRIDVSSTEVRERVAAGRSIRFLVPESVRRGIEENGLYAVPEASTGSRHT
jgi:nicotinate-nucleotide adenylyltransferase